MSELYTHAADDQRRLFNRELCWLRFNDRVLEEAEDARNPLLERLRFLAIVASNLDEFCMVRLAELYVHRHDGSLPPDPAGFAPHEHLQAVQRDLRTQVAAQYRCWREQVAPALFQANIAIIRPQGWQADDHISLTALWQQSIEPVLTPLAVDAAHPFPRLANRAIHVAFSLRDDDGTTTARALIAVPAGNRLLPLISRPGCFALLEDVVATFGASLFPGWQVEQAALLRITRDGSLDIDEDGAGDLLAEIEQELRNRGHGEPVRLELSGWDAPPPKELAHWLQEQLQLEDDNVIVVDGPLDLTLFFELAQRTARPELMFAPVDPLPCPVPWHDAFAAIRQQEILLHHPFQSFVPVVELVQQAARDPQVRAIKQTLYRVSGDSPIVQALMSAALAGKQVTVLVELKARFDEAANIRWARRLEEAGAHVIYGVAGLKVHCKLLLIIRQDDDGIRRYCHIGTGNYNDKTARLYTDLSYLTSNEAVGRDVAALFNQLTGFSRPPHWERMAVSPTSMRPQFVAWIRREASNARAGHPARIVAKFNSLVDIGIAEELYAASQAGVHIDLYVRGICVLRPGIAGLSERIRVFSIVGRYLEHSRMYHFLNHGRDPVVAIASADWMSRNLDRRVEALVRIEEPGLRQRILGILAIVGADNRQARQLQADGSYRRLQPGEDEPERPSQAALMAEASRYAPQVEPDRAARRGEELQPLTSARRPESA